MVNHVKPNVVGLEVTGDEIHGLPGGFMGVRRLHLSTRRDDGTQSSPFICDFLVRPIGVDAVVVAIWHRGADGVVSVVLRRGLRPALAMGRAPEDLPVPDTQRYLLFTEVVAGIIERGDVGEAGIRRRAALEVSEEAGYSVPTEAIEFLGAATFPSPGSMPEKFWMLSVEIADRDAQGELEGDGSPMEEGGSTLWMPLDEAVAACVAGAIEDAKTELILRRLKDALS